MLAEDVFVPWLRVCLQSQVKESLGARIDPSRPAIRIFRTCPTGAYPWVIELILGSVEDPFYGLSARSKNSAWRQQLKVLLSGFEDVGSRNETIEEHIAIIFISVQISDQGLVSTASYTASSATTTARSRRWCEVAEHLWLGGVPSTDFIKRRV